MAGYTPDSHVTVRPFTHRCEGDTVLLGDIDRQVFVAIPAEGLDILESLAAGKTVRETALAYEEKYDDTPDIETFLEALEAEGFVGESSAMARGEVPEVRQARKRWRLEWLSTQSAQRLVSWPVLAACGVIIIVGAAMAVHEPSVLPRGGNALLFPIHFAALTWATIFFVILGVVLHELSHVVAARAAGVSASMGIGNALYVVVAQTDMTAIWLSPKRQRYVAFAIGAIVDAVLASFLIACLWSVQRGWISPSEWVVLLLTAVLLTCLLRIFWQFCFFLRTDGYYIIATAFDCKNLMADTDNYLRNQWARLRRSPPKYDQSGIPAHEMRVVRWFSLLWFFGRFVALGFLVFVIIPILWGYTYQFILLVTGNETQFNSFDYVTVALIFFALRGGGVFMWVRGLKSGGRERKRGKLPPRVDRAERVREPAGVAPPGV
jgi:putative peptide zinc metalloprotease protein